MISTLRFLAAVPALIAVSTMPASASRVPFRSLFHHSSSTSAQKPSIVVMEFRNTSFEDRAVQIGSNQFRIAAGGHTRVYVPVGSKVTVRSNVNSRVDGTLLIAATSGEEGQYILVN